jgi:DNA-binding transcriptional ArsR family regulator
MAKRQEITIKKSPPVFGEKAEWQTVESPDLAATIYRALDDPVRATIFGLLDEGPIRQIDLARMVNAATGKRYDVSAILHHLALLEKAGLVASEEFPGKQTKIKMIYRTKDIKLQVYERPKIDVPPTSARDVDEWLLDLRRKKP